MFDKVLTYGDMGPGREHWRQGRVPTPTSQATTFEMVCKDEFEDDGSDEPGESEDPGEDRLDP